MTRTIIPGERAERVKGLRAGENAILGMIALDAPAEEPSIPRGTETILLVEDEETVRRSIAHMLTRYGYRIHAARSGRPLWKFGDNTINPSS
ncbi:MAG: response regulator [Verrucomicrobia bacterium]|nr:response regulator [Verrucomicrobiota bacterium]MBV8485025.1 response regulator [Verrucomicrobiota bacterium]